MRQKTENDTVKTQFFNITREPSGSLTIYLYGEIGDYADVRCAQVAAELMAAAPGAQIDLRINSIGGEVYSGIAIYNAIRNSRGNIHIYVDGVAASMAGVIALCGRPVSMSKYARLMLHSVSGGCYGDRNELQRCLKEISALEDSLADIIAKRINIEPEAVKAKYFDGTDHWMTAEEALAAHFIDSIYDADPVEGDTPEDIYTTFNHRLRQGGTKPDNKMDLNELKKRARFAACADDNAALVELDKLEAEAAESASLKTRINDLEAKVKEHEATIAAAEEAERKALLDAAEKDGRITAATRPTYENILKASPADGKAALEAMKPRRSVMQDINRGGSPGGAVDSQWHDKSWDELDRAGKLADLRKSAPEVYKAKFKDKFGKEPNI